MRLNRRSEWGVLAVMLFILVASVICAVIDWASFSEEYVVDPETLFWLLIALGMFLHALNFICCRRMVRNDALQEVGITVTNVDEL